MTTNFLKIKEFHDTFGREPDPTSPTIRDYDNRLLRAKLILEETKELLLELGFLVAGDVDGFVDVHPIVTGPTSDKCVDLKKVAKETADLLYVTYGTAAALGIDADRAFAEVHLSNMSKLDENGQVIRREDGKVLKSKLYKAPELAWIGEFDGN